MENRSCSLKGTSSTAYTRGNCTPTSVSQCNFKFEVPKKRPFLSVPSRIVTHSCPLEGALLLNVFQRLLSCDHELRYHAFIRFDQRSLQLSGQQEHAQTCLEPPNVPTLFEIRTIAWDTANFSHSGRERMVAALRVVRGEC